MAYHIEPAGIRGPWSFFLPYTKTPPGLSANDRGHWAQRAKSTQQVRFAVFNAVRGLQIPFMARCRVDVEWVVRTRARRDTDNLSPLLKAIYDGIGSDRGVSARIVEDDAPEFMSKPGATIRYDKDAVQHFVVTITELPETP